MSDLRQLFSIEEINAKAYGIERHRTKETIEKITETAYNILVMEFSKLLQQEFEDI